MNHEHLDFSSQYSHKMKSLITIVSLLVSTEIQFTLCAVANDFTNGNFDKSSNRQGTEGNKSLKSSNFLQKNEATKPQATPNETKNIQGASPSNVKKMKSEAVANFNNAMQNAISTYEKVKTKVETLKKKADIERDEALKKGNEQYRKVESIVDAIEKAAMRKLKEAEVSARNECHRAVSQANEKLKQAREEHDTAYTSADNVFAKTLGKIEENKRKLETQFEETIKRAQKVRQTARESAKEKRDQAQEYYKKAISAITSTSKYMWTKERVEIGDKYQDEMEKYDEALELADNEWHKVLDAIGIGRQYEEALEQAVKELEQVQEKADLILKGAMEEHDKALKEAETKKYEAYRLAQEENMKIEDQYEDIVERAGNRYDHASKKAWRLWRKTQAQADKELQKANAEFSNAKKEAVDECKKILLMANEMQKQLMRKATQNVILLMKSYSEKKSTESSPKKQDI